MSPSERDAGLWRTARLKMCALLGLTREHPWHPDAAVVCDHPEQYLQVIATWDGEKFVDHKWQCGRCEDTEVVGPMAAIEAFNRANNYRPHTRSTR